MAIDWKKITQITQNTENGFVLAFYYKELKLTTSKSQICIKYSALLQAREDYKMRPQAEIDESDDIPGHGIPEKVIKELGIPYLICNAEGTAEGANYVDEIINQLRYDKDASKNVSAWSIFSLDNLDGEAQNCLTFFIAHASGGTFFILIPMECIDWHS